MSSTTADPGPNPTSSSAPPAARRENVWVNLICNAILPGFLLQHLSKDKFLGPIWGLVVSLALPVGYGIYDHFKRRRWNMFSVLGFVSVLLSGILGLLKTDAFWFAVKEAAFPTLLGLAIPLTLRTKQPLVRTLLYNEQVLNTVKVEHALAERQNIPAFERLLVWASWVLASAFGVSAVLNYVLARWMLKAPPGTPEFNAQLGRMNWVSWPVIMIPMMAMMFYALFRLLRGIEELTGLKTDDLFHHPHPQNQSAPKTNPPEPESERPAA